MVMSVGDYVKEFCSEHRELLHMYESITASLQSASQFTFDEYISGVCLSKEIEAVSVVPV